MKKYTEEMSSNLFEILGDHIKKARIAKGYSGKQLGDKVHLSQQQISRYERGVNKIDLETLLRFFEVLEVEPIVILNIIKNIIKCKYNLVDYE